MSESDLEVTKLIKELELKNQFRFCTIHSFWVRVNSIADLKLECKDNPELIHYTGLQASGDHIYYGLMMPDSSFLSYHAVVIEEVKQINNEWVAVCKLSNGELVGDCGYVNVSLATQYIPVGVSDEKSRFVRGSEEPMHLLTDFIILEDDENETEDDENEDGKNEDKKKDSKEKNRRTRNRKKNTKTIFVNQKEVMPLLLHQKEVVEPMVVYGRFQVQLITGFY